MALLMQLFQNQLNKISVYLVPSLSSVSSITFPPTQISCFATSNDLSDRTRFRSYFQMLPTLSAIAPAYFEIIRQYGWRRVALIVQNENVFTVVSLGAAILSKCYCATLLMCVTPLSISYCTLSYRRQMISKSSCSPLVLSTPRKFLRVKRALLDWGLNPLTLWLEFSL